MNEHDRNQRPSDNDEQAYTGDTVPMNVPPSGAPRSRQIQQPPRSRQIQQPPSGAPRSRQIQQPPSGAPRSRQIQQPPREVPPPSQPARRQPRQNRSVVAPPIARPRRVARGNPVARWARRVVIGLIIALIVVVVGTIVFQQRVASRVRMADVRDNRPVGNLLVTPMNVLLLGVDLRQDNPQEGVRSDTLMLLHLDPASGWGSMLSIPRDTWTTVPGFGESKINTAFARGYESAADDSGRTAAGAALAADTVEEFLQLRQFGQRIDYVATIDFNGFAAMIDAIGGIDVDVPFEIIDDEYPTEDFGYTSIHIPAGMQHMDGTTALQYVRTRHADSDFGRAQRQQQVIQAIVERLRGQPMILRPFSALRLVDAASNSIRTTMPIGRPDALLMAGMLARIGPEQITQYRVSPEQVGVQEIGSDLVWDAAGVQALVQEFFTPPGEGREGALVQVLNGSGVSGVAGQLTDVLGAAKFVMTSAGNAEQQAESVIIDYGSHPITRARLSATLGNMPIEQRAAEDAPGNATLVVILGEDYESYWKRK